MLTKVIASLLALVMTAMVLVTPAAAQSLPKITTQTFPLSVTVFDSINKENVKFTGSLEITDWSWTGASTTTVGERMVPKNLNGVGEFSGEPWTVLTAMDDDNEVDSHVVTDVRPAATATITAVSSNKNSPDEYLQIYVTSQMISGVAAAVNATDSGFGTTQGVPQSSSSFTTQTFPLSVTVFDSLHKENVFIAGSVEVTTSYKPTSLSDASNSVMSVVTVPHIITAMGETTGTLWAAPHEWAVQSQQFPAGRISDQQHLSLMFTISNTTAINQLLEYVLTIQFVGALPVAVTGSTPAPLPTRTP